MTLLCAVDPIARPPHPNEYRYRWELDDPDEAAEATAEQHDQERAHYPPSHEIWVKDDRHDTLYKYQVHLNPAPHYAAVWDPADDGTPTHQEQTARAAQGRQNTGAP